MENKSIFNNVDNDRGKLELTWESISFLESASKWAKFLAILGFIMAGFMAIVSFFMGSILGLAYGASPLAGVSSVFITLIYLVVAALIFLPALFLYKFSSKVKDAIASINSDTLSLGLKSLKSYFAFNGIIAIIVIAFYALLFIVAIIAGIAGNI